MHSLGDDTNLSFMYLIVKGHQPYAKLHGGHKGKKL